LYQLDWAKLRGRGRTTGSARLRVSSTVWLLGITSLLTDISSEMVNGILPLYVVGFLRLNPLQFGVIDGLYQGVSAVLRLVGGVLADRWRRHKEIALAGYGLSAVCKLGLLFAGTSWPLLASVIALDRTGKGLRTAPRDAMITLSSDRNSLGASFGVHRSLDAAGALLGPIAAFAVLWAAPDAFDIVFVASFAFAVLGAGVLVLFVPPAPDLAAASSSFQEQPRLSLRTLLGQPAFQSLILAASALALTTMSDAFIYLTLQQRLAFSPTVFPLLYVTTSLVYVVLAAPVGRLADRFGQRNVFLGGYLLLGVVYISLLAPGAGGWGAALGILGLGGYYAATDGVLMAIAGRLLPKESLATGLAVLTTCTSLARLGSSVAFGWIWNAGDVAAAVRVFGIGLILAMIAVVSMARLDGRDSATTGEQGDDGDR
jgi:MFS family permease